MDKKIAWNCLNQEMFGLLWAPKTSAQNYKVWLPRKKDRKCMILSDLLDAEMENLDDYGWLGN